MAPKTKELWRSWSPADFSLGLVYLWVSQWVCMSVDTIPVTGDLPFCRFYLQPISPFLADHTSLRQLLNGQGGTILVGAKVWCPKCLIHIFLLLCSNKCHVFWGVFFLIKRTFTNIPKTSSDNISNKLPNRTFHTNSGLLLTNKLINMPTCSSSIRVMSIYKMTFVYKLIWLNKFSQAKKGNPSKTGFGKLPERANGKLRGGTCSEESEAQRAGAQTHWHADSCGAPPPSARALWLPFGCNGCRVKIPPANQK